MVFDVKITLTRKARLLADGHRVPDLPKETTYSSVPSLDSVQLFFLLAALNDLDVLSANIQNAYLTTPIKEKLVWNVNGVEVSYKLFGDLIVQAYTLGSYPILCQNLI